MLRRVLNKYRHLTERFYRWRLARSKTQAAAFELIYRLNFWAGADGPSGPGSTLDYTANLRAQLPALLDRYSIRSVFDAPCGDFRWMPFVLAERSVDYTGGDIVRALIRRHRRTAGNSRTRFLVFDITKDKFPAADLWICRDCLFHLPFRAIFQALSMFADSQISFALLTNHRVTTPFRNVDVPAGGFRPLDLFSVPFHLPPAVASRITEGSGPDSRHEMCLWSREQIKGCLPLFAAELAREPMIAPA